MNKYTLVTTSNNVFHESGDSIETVFGMYLSNPTTFGLPVNIDETLENGDTNQYQKLTGYAGWINMANRYYKWDDIHYEYQTNLYYWISARLINHPNVGISFENGYVITISQEWYKESDFCWKEQIVVRDNKVKTAVERGFNKVKFGVQRDDLVLAITCMINKIQQNK